jgi:senataxin
LLVIDEAAQLKECESTIPLQLSGLRHAILIGDERQLPAMVQSKVIRFIFLAPHLLGYL